MKNCYYVFIQLNLLLYQFLGNSSGGSHPARPLARAFSSPLVALNSEAGPPTALNTANMNHYVQSVKLSG